MKEDILEQIAEDYYTKQKGLFTKHNLKFRPSDKDKKYNSQDDSVHSDVDIVVIDSKRRNRIIVVSCKSWQGGLNIIYYKNTIETAIKKQPSKTKGKRDAWCTFRELCINKWTDAFVETLKSELGIKAGRKLILEYVILCTKITSKSKIFQNAFENSKIIANHFKNRNVIIALKIRTIDSMLENLIKSIQSKDTPSVENTHFSRTLQLIIASGHEIRKAEIIKTKTKPHNKRLNS